MSQTERVMYILDQLMEKGYFRIKDVASLYEVSLKQVRRDKNYLMTRCPLSCGNLDIYYDAKDKVFRLSAESSHNLASWRADESLLMARDREKNRPFSSRFPSSVISGDSGYVKYKSYAREDFRPGIYLRLMEALKNSKRILLRYLSAERLRRIEPLKLVNYGEIWYLAAIDVDKGERIVTFSLSRIISVEIIDEDIVFSDFAKLERFLDGYGIFNNDQQESEYVIHFTGWAKDIVKNQIWQKRQSLKELEDGTLELHLPVSNDTELLSRILFYGTSAMPVSPASFVEKYRKACIEMAGRFA